MIRYSWALWLLMLVSAQAEKQVAVTIDDLPFAYGRYLADHVEVELFREIMGVLKEHEVKIVGFICGSRIKQCHTQLLNDFISDGHVLGNHTSTHPDLNNTAADWYIEDIASCDSAIAKWTDTFRYFRYPFLHRGSTEVKYEAVSRYLQIHSFTTVPVTIDNNDWWYNKERTKALREGDQDLASSIGKGYLEHMKEATEYFDSLAMARYDRDIKHILLLHMNELNSVYLDTLLTWYEDQGWRFITTEEALTDPIYREDDTYLDKNGISWLLRL